MTDVAEIARGLTKAQREALLHPEAGGCTYGWTRMRTAEALAARKLVRRENGLGDLFFPTTNIKWPLTMIGARVRDYLKEQG